jgi:Na+-translocating ferredoxin:NAD+ oxidoreductase RnfA subunit
VLLRLYLVRFPVIMEDLGVYVPLAAVNMMMVEVATRAGKQSLHDAVREALSYSIGFALVMCGLSAVREIMSLHTIWDIPLRVPTVTISGAGLPCFGFILLGFFAAFGRALNRARIRMMLRRSAETPVGREESV